MTGSMEMERRLRRWAGVTVLVVGLSAALLSYAGLRHLAVAAGIHPVLALLLPVVVDGAAVMGVLVVLHAAVSRTSATYGWVLVWTGVLLSVWGNAVSTDGGVTARLVHALPPVVLALSVHALAGFLHTRIEVVVQTEEEQAAAVEEEQRRETRALERQQREDERRTRAASRAGLSPRAAAYRDAVMTAVGMDASLTEQAVALLGYHDEHEGGRVPAADVASALGVSIDQARKAVERGRIRQREQGRTDTAAGDVVRLVSAG